MNSSWRRSVAGALSPAAIACVLLCAGVLHAQAQVVARAASVTGPAVILSPGAAAMVLNAGFTLSPGDRIDTRGGGRVVIDLSDGSMVVVAPESVVVLKDYRMANTLRELFDITLGTVRVKINHFAGKPNPYRMNSPTASIAVRGTEFTIAVGLTGATQVDVIEGLVEVASLSDPSRSVLLESGRGVLVQLGQDLRLIGAAGPQPGQGTGGRDGDRGAPPGAAPPQGGNAPAGQAGNPAGGAQKAANQPPPAPQQNAPKPADPQPQPQPRFQPQPVVAQNDRPEHDRDHDDGPRASASTYDRYIAGLADVGQVPFLLRFNAFSEAHLDSLENPAYAGQFRAPEGRLLFLPTFRGSQTLREYQSAFGPGGTLPSGYSVSPQLSFFAPVGGFTFGGAASFSRIGDSSASVTWPPDPGHRDDRPAPPPPDGASGASNFWSGALIGARRFGDNSVGLELSSLRGTGVDASQTASDIHQTRLTAGYARNLGATTTLAFFYRYAFIDASERGFAPNATASSGHSSEAGVRLRGMISPRVYYGATAAWLGVGLRDTISAFNVVPSRAADRARRGSAAFGIGYALTPHTVFTFDVAGGWGHIGTMRNEDATGHLLQNARDRSRFGSIHGAIQHDVTRRVFVSASLLQVWQSHGLAVDLFPDRFGMRMLVQSNFFPVSASTPYASRFSDFGAGWRFSRDLYAQYVYSTDYGTTTATHTLMLRWTFRLKGQ